MYCISIIRLLLVGPIYMYILSSKALLISAWSLKGWLTAGKGWWGCVKSSGENRIASLLGNIKLCKKVDGIMQ